MEDEYQRSPHRRVLASARHCAIVVHVEESLHYLESGTLDAVDEPFRVYLTCYRVLVANEDWHTPGILTAAHQLLQEQLPRSATMNCGVRFWSTYRRTEEIAKEVKGGEA